MICRLAFALASAALLLSAPASAQNSAASTVTVNGNVISALTIATTTAVTMPTVVKPIESGSSSVQIDCTAATSTTTGVATWSPQANPFANGNPAVTTVAASSTNATTAPGAKTGTCGSVVVNGESGYYFLATSGAGTITTPSSDVLAFIGNCTTASTVLTGGTATIYCGAVVSVGPLAVANYTGTIPVTVTYD
jgi:hypothetical protein